MINEELLENYTKALALGMIGYSDKQIQEALNLSNEQMNELLEMASDN